MRRQWFSVRLILSAVLLSTMTVSGNHRDIVEIYSDSFEVGVFGCTGPYGDNACWLRWESMDPTSSGLPAACHGNLIAWHGFETCNFPHGPDHLLIMNGVTEPEHDMTGCSNIELQLQWYQNTNLYGETVEIYVADAPFSTLDCGNLSVSWEFIYGETNLIYQPAGTCGTLSVFLPTSYDNATNLVVAIRYIGMDGDSVGIDRVTLLAERSIPTPTPTATMTPQAIPSTEMSGILVLLSGMTLLILGTGYKKSNADS